MPSFDIVSKVDQQVLDNAVNITKKEITNRFDFKDSPVKIDLNKKDMKIDLEAESDMKLKQIVDVLISRSMKQGVDEAGVGPVGVRPRKGASSKWKSDPAGGAGAKRAETGGRQEGYEIDQGFGAQGPVADHG
jgi:uncharacterized protein YajQ (UPF0234 family)